MKIPDWLPCYGDRNYRGECPKEGAEQVTFFNKLRKEYPETWGRLAIHPKNEEKRSGPKFRQLERDKAMGLSTGASDIIIPGKPSFVCEMKRKDHTQSKWEPDQLPYLEAAHKVGSFACVALGWEGAWQAFEEWLKLQ